MSSLAGCQLLSLLMLALVGVASVRAVSLPAQVPALIAGVVVAADTGAPVRGARVVITGGSRDEGRGTTTGDSGEFAFSNVPSGRYELWVARVGFVTASYGERRLGLSRPGLLVVVDGKARTDNLVVTIPRAGAISGTILDEFGDPAIGARVSVLRYRMLNGRRMLVSAGSAEVDDRGFYRVFSLPPGSYIIQVRGYRGLAIAEMATRDGYDAAPRQLFRSDPASGYTLAAYAGLFYPGVAALAEAIPVPLALGEEKVNVGLRLHRVGLSRITGLVLQPDGTPMPRADVRLVQLGPAGEDDGAAGPLFSAAVNLDGEFTFNNVLPGKYSIAARARLGPDEAVYRVQWALQELTIAGGTLEQVTLSLREGLPVTGRVQAESGERPDWLGGVVFTPTGQARFLTERTVLHAGADPNGSFAITNLVPGRYAVEARPLPEGWRLASALFGTREAMDFLVDVQAGGTPPGVLTLTNRETELSGTVMDATGAATNAVTLVLFSADERHWLPEQRRNQFRVPSVEGRFTFKDLPAGRYWLAAVTDFDPYAGLGAELLRELAGNSPLTISLVDGEKKVQDIRLR